MKRHARHFGFTLSEVLVVVSAMVLLTVLAVPATKKIVASFESASGVRRVIAAALSNARAIAAKEQKYTGVRFQQDLNGDQYIIFIIHDPGTAPYGYANGFRAVEGRKPIKLPSTVGVMDLRIRIDRANASVNADKPIEVVVGGVTVPGLSNENIDDVFELYDTTSFSVVFSPVGRLVIHDVRVWNREKKASGDLSCMDDFFNVSSNVDSGTGMFYQDDYAGLGLGQEMSRNCFIIYEKKRLQAAPPARRWTDYLQELAQLDMLYVNPHTGELVNN